MKITNITEEITLTSSKKRCESTVNKEKLIQMVKQCSDSEYLVIIGGMGAALFGSNEDMTFANSKGYCATWNRPLNK